MKWIEIALQYCTFTLISSMERKEVIFNVKYQIVLRTPYSKVRWGAGNNIYNMCMNFLLKPPLSSYVVMYLCRKQQICFFSQRVKVQPVTKIADKEREAVENGHHHKIGQTPIVLQANQSHKQNSFILSAICIGNLTLFGLYLDTLSD